MSWIEIIDQEDATGQLDQVYQKICQRRGKLSNVMRVHSLHPDAMEKHMDLYLSLMFEPSELHREQREIIAVVVSVINQCSYCIHHHSEALNHYWKDTTKINKFIDDIHSLSFSESINSMIRFVETLTKTPDTIGKDDIQNLKQVGFSDKSILDITLITSYFNFVNRIVLGLGVEFSDDEVKGYRF